VKEWIRSLADDQLMNRVKEYASFSGVL